MEGCRQIFSELNGIILFIWQNKTQQMRSYQLKGPTSVEIGIPQGLKHNLPVFGNFIHLGIVNWCYYIIKICLYLTFLTDTEIVLSYANVTNSDILATCFSRQLLIFHCNTISICNLYLFKCRAHHTIFAILIII